MNEQTNPPSYTGKEREILIYPHPFLRKKARPVTQFDQQLKELIQDMICTMYQASGIGLAATQIGVDQRIFILDVDYSKERIVNAEGKEEFEYLNRNPQVFINPELSNLTGEMTFQEGCLSFPAEYDNITRPSSLTATFYDENGEQHILEADELLAICIQHEYDHLNGVLFIDHLSVMKRNLIKKKFEKKKKRNG